MAKDQAVEKFVQIAHRDLFLRSDKAVSGCWGDNSFVAYAIIFADMGNLKLLFAQKTHKKHLSLRKNADICDFSPRKAPLKVILNYRRVIFSV